MPNKISDRAIEAASKVYQKYNREGMLLGKKPDKKLIRDMLECTLDREPSVAELLLRALSVQRQNLTYYQNRERDYRRELEDYGDSQYYMGRKYTRDFVKQAAEDAAAGTLHTEANIEKVYTLIRAYHGGKSFAHGTPERNELDRL